MKQILLKLWLACTDKVSDDTILNISCEGILHWYSSEILHHNWNQKIEDTLFCILAMSKYIITVQSCWCHSHNRTSLTGSIEIIRWSLWLLQGPTAFSLKSTTAFFDWDHAHQIYQDAIRPKSTSGKSFIGDMEPTEMLCTTYKIYFT